MLKEENNNISLNELLNMNFNEIVLLRRTIAISKMLYIKYNSEFITEFNILNDCIYFENKLKSNKRVILYDSLNYVPIRIGDLFKVFLYNIEIIVDYIEINSKINTEYFKELYNDRSYLVSLSIDELELLQEKKEVLIGNSRQ